MSRAPNMEADATDPASPIVERELTARLMRWNSDVRGLPILFWPIYGLLDSGRSAWWLFLILAGLHVLCFALYLRLARSHAAGSDRESPEYWLHLHLVLTVANGLVAGVGAAVVAWSADISVRVVLCLLLIIFAFGASSRAYSARIYAGYVAALLMPMSVALMLTQQTIAMVLGLAALPILGAGMLLLARGQRRLAREMVSAALSHERLLHRLEAANTASEDARGTLRTALNALSDAVVLYGADKRLLFINDVALRTMGTDRAEELIGLTLKELVGRQIEAGEFGPLGPAERAAAIDLREQLLEHGTDGWHSLPRRDRWLEVSVSILAEGRRLVVHRDVTDLKNSETRATEARAKLVAAMESMAGGIAFFDAEERMELCNESFKWFMNNDPVICSPGVTLEDAHRRGALRLAPEIREKAVEDALRRHRAEQSVLIPFGDNRWARLLMRYTGDGRATLLATDVTEQRQRQRELERALDAAEAARAESDAANQAKSTFLATMSHEIRTPMNGVLGMIEVLGREKLDDEQRDLVQTMRDSAGTVLRLLDDLLDFSKIEAGRTELEQVAFSLSSVVERAADNFRSAAAAKGISVSVAMSPGSADALIGDPTRVRQIVANLIGNAVKFTERGAVIVRALTQPLGEGRTEIEISVSDTGIGMDEMQLAGLFKPFAQADSGTTRRYGGTGLGLSIVRRLAQLMDGDVTVQSAPGAGSTFIATLVLQAAPADSPLVELQAQAGPAASGAPVAPAVSSRARVLVVDDHPVNLKVALRQLASLGVAADTAANGRDGLERWRAGDYALVLADVHMPDMDGFEMTALIRAEESRRGLPRTPIVASTANALKGEDERCRAAGMDGYLAKPVETDRLRAVIERWLPSADPSAVRADIEAVRDPDDGAILDRSVLNRWSGGDAAFERDLLDTFAGELDQSERDIDAAMQAGDLARVAQAAHRLKGSALQIGARRAGAAALALEEAGKAADRQRCQDARGRLAIELRRLTVVLQSAAPQSVGGTNM